MNLSLASLEFGERTWPNPGSESRERSGLNPGLAGLKFRERNGLNLGLAGSEFRDKTWVRVS